MAVLPDLGSATLAAVVVGLGALGILVVFVETLSRGRLAAILVGDAAVVAALVISGEAGLGLVALGPGAAALSYEALERITTR